MNGIGRPIVIGWVARFGLYAYDFVDYTFYPHAYDTFWPYAYDDSTRDVGAFGRYAQGYLGGYDWRYAAVDRIVGVSRQRRARGRSLQWADPGLTDWPIERIAQWLGPTMHSAPSSMISGTRRRGRPILEGSVSDGAVEHAYRRIEAMGQRLDARLEAVASCGRRRDVLPVAQRRAEGALQCAQPRRRPIQKQSQRNLTQACGERAWGIAKRAPGADRTCSAARRSAAQRAQGTTGEATSEAANLLSGLPYVWELTPVVRLQAMEQRLDAMRAGAYRAARAREVLRRSPWATSRKRYQQAEPCARLRCGKLGRKKNQRATVRSPFQYPRECCLLRRNAHLWGGRAHVGIDVLLVLDEKILLEHAPACARSCRTRLCPSRS